METLAAAKVAGHYGNDGEKSWVGRQLWVCSVRSDQSANQSHTTRLRHAHAQLSVSVYRVKSLPSSVLRSRSWSPEDEDGDGGDGGDEEERPSIHRREAETIELEGKWQREEWKKWIPKSRAGVRPLDSTADRESEWEREGERQSPSPSCLCSEQVGCTLGKRAFDTETKREREQGSKQWHWQSLCRKHSETCSSSCHRSCDCSHHTSASFSIFLHIGLA